MAERMRAAVIGHPISHSLSPAIFAEFARATGIALEYEAVDIAPDDLASTLEAWRRDARFVGCNVTIPHKVRVFESVDARSDAAQACEAVNAVRREGSLLIGDNTDVAGIAATFAQVHFDPAGARAVVFGAGGAARAVVTVLADRGAAEVWIVARSRDQALALAHAASARSPKTAFTPLEMHDELPPPANLYVNATPLGMSGRPMRSLIPTNAPAQALAFDLVYRPARTPFLCEAGERGLRTVGGFTMLLEQALATFEGWFSVRPVLDAETIERLESLAAPSEAVAR